VGVKKDVERGYQLCKEVVDRDIEGDAERDYR
jgi:hypothetical protein